MNKKLIVLSLSWMMCSFATHAFSTKGEVDYRINEFKQYFIQKLRQDAGRKCEERAYYILQGIDEAHKQFMADNTLGAALKTIAVIEQSEIAARQMKFCSLYYYPQVRTAALYMRFMLQEHPEQKIVQTQQVDTLLPDKEREQFSQLFDIGFRKGDEVCRRVVCNKYNIKLVEASQSMRDALKKPGVKAHQFLVELVSMRALLARNADTQPFEFHNKVIIWYTDALWRMMRVTKQWAFPNDTSNFYESFQLRLINHLLNETSPHSTCPILLNEYYMSVDRKTSGNLKKDLVEMMNIQAQNFEMIMRIHAGWDSITHCATPFEELVQYPHDFSKAVKEQVKQLPSF